MDMNEKQLSFLNSVRSFGKIRRYYGMMPAKLLMGQDDISVHQAFAQGLVAFASVTVELERELELRGVVLTDKGVQFLMQQPVSKQPS